MSKQTKALKLALEALEEVTKELLAVRDELAERGGRPRTNVFHQRLWDSAFKAYTDHALPAATAIREALAEPDYKALYEKAAQQYNELAELIAEQPAQQQEPVAWATQLNEYAHIKWGAKRPEYPMVYEFPLYTSTPASKPLTMQERTSIVRANKSFHDKNEIDAYGIIDDVEAAHGIKENT